MAKRRHRRRSKSKTVVYRRSSAPTVRAVAPVVVRERVSAPTRRHHRRRHSGGAIGGFGGGLASKENIALGMGALALGFIDKNQDKWHIPEVPLIGRKGSIAVLAHFGGKHLHMPILNKISKAAIVLALYELGHEGKISGVDVL
jgi:hypothetical protein